MPSFRTASLPIPAEELQRIRDYLAPQYGTQLWTDDRHRVLLVRVPREEPDPVNDLEAAVEYAAPGDAKELTHLLLLGERRIEAVYPGPLMTLMQERVQFDAKECSRLRGELSPHGHRLYTASADPRRLVRLALRLPKASVKDLDDEDLDAFADGIGSELEGSRVRGARAVYLIADEDHARLDGDLFIPDLRERWQDQDRRRRIVLDKERRIREEQEAKERRRQEIVREMESRFRVARAPLRRPATTRWEAEPDGPPLRSPLADGSARASIEGPASQDRRRATSLEDRVDAVIRKPARAPGPAARATGKPAFEAALPASAADAWTAAEAAGTRGDAARWAPPEARAPDGSLAARVEAPARPAAPRSMPAPTAPAAAPVPSPLRGSPAETATETAIETAPPASARTAAIPAQAKARLEDLGYDVLVAPTVPGHQIDLAAERAQGYPNRVLAWFPPRLTTAVADAMLEAARALQCDVALAVAEAADPEAERRLVATKGKWVRPQELSSLGL